MVKRTNDFLFACHAAAMSKPHDMQTENHWLLNRFDRLSVVS